MDKIRFNRFSNKSYYELMVNGDISTNDAMKQLIFNYNTEDTDKDAIEKNSEESVEYILTELNELIGLESVKELINEIMAYSEIQSKRMAEGLRTDPLVMHMIFKGNPGTGKTTVARLLGRLYKAMGILEKGHLIEIERADLVGEYIGHTAIKVKEQVKNAIGGILFIDEAYSLARGGEKDFGKEAIDALVKAMEDYRDNLILILAGYHKEMEHFIMTNPGLRSRFPINITFEDYTIEQLVQIAELMVERREYKFSKSSKAKLFNLLALKRRRDGDHSGNARLVRNLIEKAIRKQAVRLNNNYIYTREDLITLNREDFVDGED